MVYLMAAGVGIDPPAKKNCSLVGSRRPIQRATREVISCVKKRHSPLLCLIHGKSYPASPAACLKNYCKSGGSDGIHMV